MDHETWLSSEGKEGKQADLDSANLQGANLREADLSRANLQKAVLMAAASAIPRPVASIQDG